ncbi:unnamed protein product [Amoebophrya sp. A120]|nr:unnamed protein product [Amoebophrya sp. A120]|eukprot:GSA120T00016220001.1
MVAEERLRSPEVQRAEIWKAAGFQFSEEDSARCSGSDDLHIRGHRPFQKSKSLDKYGLAFRYPQVTSVRTAKRVGDLFAIAKEHLWSEVLAVGDDFVAEQSDAEIPTHEMQDQEKPEKKTLARKAFDAFFSRKMGQNSSCSGGAGRKSRRRTGRKNPRFEVAVSGASTSARLDFHLPTFSSEETTALIQNHDGLTLRNSSQDKFSTALKLKRAMFGEAANPEVEKSLNLLQTSVDYRMQFLLDRKILDIVVTVVTTSDGDSKDVEPQHENQNDRREQRDDDDDEAVHQEMQENATKDAVEVFFDRYKLCFELLTSSLTSAQPRFLQHMVENLVVLQQPPPPPSVGPPLKRSEQGKIINPSGITTKEDPLLAPAAAAPEQQVAEQLPAGFMTASSSPVRRNHDPTCQWSTTARRDPQAMLHDVWEKITFSTDLLTKLSMWLAAADEDGSDEQSSTCSDEEEEQQQEHLLQDKWNPGPPRATPSCTSRRPPPLPPSSAENRKRAARKMLARSKRLRNVPLALQLAEKLPKEFPLEKFVRDLRSCTSSDSEGEVFPLDHGRGGERRAEFLFSCSSSSEDEINERGDREDDIIGRGPAVFSPTGSEISASLLHEGSGPAPVRACSAPRHIFYRDVEVLRSAGGARQLLTCGRRRTLSSPSSDDEEVLRVEAPSMEEHSGFYANEADSDVVRGGASTRAVYTSAAGGPATLALHGSTSSTGAVSMGSSSTTTRSTPAPQQHSGPATSQGQHLRLPRSKNHTESAGARSRGGNDVATEVKIISL